MFKNRCNITRKHLRGFQRSLFKELFLDPAHFYTVPGLDWKACLKKKNRKRLELLIDPDMLLMFERGIRGGITQSVHRWAEANNPYMEDKFNLNEKTNYLHYFCNISMAIIF